MQSWKDTATNDRKRQELNIPRISLLYACVVALIVFVAVSCSFAYTPLVTSDMFTGVQTDVITTATAIISIFIVLVGLALIVRALSK